MIWRQGRIWDILLLVANALLLGAIIGVWSGETTLPVKANAKAGVAVPQVPVLADKQPLSAFQIVQTKDLFSPQRMAFHLCPDPSKGQATLEGGKLQGIIIIGQEKAAIISSPDSRGRPQVQVVRQGEEWRGFKVVEICTEAVLFQGKGISKTLTFPTPLVQSPRGSALRGGPSLESEEPEVPPEEMVEPEGLQEEIAPEEMWEEEVIEDSI
ncbi:MAG: hypothetical protein JRI57_04640 [Deltaproteobacteria bacterium]|nr:hypothetical protein [Deltaproteobacteria bacterium]MBW1952545.1 hypothetical protein [Deltaproteobacteria bacterium]MBW1986108.1 hypothetical protein [Deltaproteobacteria bacterium]MBW2134206.1 hypothetical protein [Deltaproteobacteria bacterium]